MIGPLSVSASAPAGVAGVRPAFHDADLQAQFDHDGFVVVPFIDDDRRNQLRDLFTTLDPGITKGFYVSLDSQDAAYRVAVHEGVRRICGDLPNRYLDDYRLLLATFAVKIPGRDSVQGIHQDLSFVDETRFVSVNCWLPVAEVRAEDGPLMVMKGSHRLFPTVRGPYQPLFHREGLRDLIVDRYLTTLDVAPGDAVLFNSRLVHYSPPNLGARPRLAVSMTTIPQEAAPRFYCPHPDGAMELLEVPLDFFYRSDLRAASGRGTSLGRVSQETPVITEADIERLYRGDAALS